jgi:hypothetical protein
MRTHRWAVLAGLTALLAGTGPSEARAQNSPPVLGPDSFLVAVPIRDTSDIKREIAAAAQAKTHAANDRAGAESLRQSAEARIARKDGEIKAIGAREEAAKKQKQSADLMAIQADKKAAEQEKELIKRRQSLREADIELAKKQGELADARRQALELELQLALRRIDYERAGTPGGPAGARAQQVLSDIEKQTLEAQQKEAEKSKDVADRQKQIIQRRLGILEAQRKLISGN